MKNNHAIFYVVLFIILNFTFAFAKNYYSVNAYFQFFGSSGDKTIESVNGTITVRSADCVIESKSGLKSYQYGQFDALALKFDRIKNTSLVDNNVILFTQYPSVCSIVEIQTKKPNKLISKINKAIKNCDKYEASCVITCTNSMGQHIINSQEGKIVLTEDNCKLIPKNADIDSGENPGIGFSIERIHDLKLNEKKKYLTFSTCNDEACDKFVEITSPHCVEIKDMILKYQSK